MAINSIAVSARSLPFNGSIEANGSYTLPQHAFIPNRALQPFANGGMVAGPALPQISGTFAQPEQLASRPYPSVALPALYGIRSVQLKQSP